jgi:hypothetical protein
VDRRLGLRRQQNWVAMLGSGLIQTSFQESFATLFDRICRSHLAGTGLGSQLSRCSMLHRQLFLELNRQRFSAELIGLQELRFRRRCLLSLATTPSNSIVALQQLLTHLARSCGRALLFDPSNRPK